MPCFLQVYWVIRRSGRAGASARRRRPARRGIPYSRSRNGNRYRSAFRERRHFQGGRRAIRPERGERCGQRPLQAGCRTGPRGRGRGEHEGMRSVLLNMDVFDGPDPQRLGVEADLFQGIQDALESLTFVFRDHAVFRDGDEAGAKGIDIL